MRNAIFVLIGLGFANASATTTCNQIREKAKSKKGKAPCVLIEHTAAPEERGESLTVYQCGKIQYKLTMLEDGSCTVSTK